MLPLQEEEVRKLYNSVRASLAQGTVSMSLWNSLLKLYICQRRKRQRPGLNDLSKKKIDENLVEVLKGLFLLADVTDGEQYKRYLEDIVLILHNLVGSDEPPSKEQY